MRTTLASLIAALALAAPAAAATLPPYIDADSAAAINVWMETHPGYRVLTDFDCGCADQLKMQRTQSSGDWKADPDYHPYYVVGDFNGDARPDVAVAVTLTATSDGSWRALVLHDIGTAAAARPFLSAPFDHTDVMFFGPPRPKPFRLLVGPFESEGVVFRPAKGGYTVR